jgi:hypothetical protein
MLHFLALLSVQLQLALCNTHVSVLDSCSPVAENATSEHTLCVVRSHCTGQDWLAATHHSIVALVTSSTHVHGVALAPAPQGQLVLAEATHVSV